MNSIEHNLSLPAQVSGCGQTLATQISYSCDSLTRQRVDDLNALLRHERLSSYSLIIDIGQCNVSCYTCQLGHSIQIVGGLVERSG